MFLVCCVTAGNIDVLKSTFATKTFKCNIFTYRMKLYFYKNKLLKTILNCYQNGAFTNDESILADSYGGPGAVSSYDAPAVPAGYAF